MNGVGILAILLGVAIIFVVMFGGFGGGGKSYVGTQLETKKSLEGQVNEMSGLDAKGERATDSLTFEAGDKGVQVLTVAPAGAFDTKYGVRPGDLIVEFGPLTAKEQASSPGAAKDMLHTAFAQNMPLTVIRNGQRLTLPDQRNAAMTPTNPPAANPAAAAPAPTDVPRNTPKGQALDLMKKIESH